MPGWRLPAQPAWSLLPPPPWPFRENWINISCYLMLSCLFLVFIILCQDLTSFLNSLLSEVLEIISSISIAIQIRELRSRALKLLAQGHAAATDLYWAPTYVLVILTINLDKEILLSLFTVEENEASKGEVLFPGSEEELSGRTGTWIQSV